ncbi:MAG: hypothetical protein A2Z25_11910 [Planctomycetes bacterium RBG_16_55_9]|nr:MAG: hypothetical protein A2Z25_11910 [Planctomycetes bacterium RBG_16_55_9]
MKESEKSKSVTVSVFVVAACICMGLVLAGCDSLRFAPSEAQKQNAWLHNRTATIAAQTARAENVSHVLQALTQLSEKQSQSFTAYYGLPTEFPPVETAEDVLAASSWQLAETALQTGADRPDPWQVADAMLEMGIGISALLGGVYGARTVRFLKEARDKSKALKEIIAGNEKFKKQNKSSAAAFKQAHGTQSPQTRQLVTQMKA